MDAYIKSECDNIVSMVIEEYKTMVALKKDEKKEDVWFDFLKSVYEEDSLEII